MIHYILSALWESAFAQFGLAGIALICAVALFLWSPSPGVRYIASAVATSCIIFLFLGPKLYIEGTKHERAKWEAAAAAAIERGRNARTEAEREIPVTEPTPAETAPAAVSGAGRGALARLLPARRMRHDRYDRDDR